MPALQPLATEPVYMDDASGVRRLVAAVGDVIPANAKNFGITTTRDPLSSGVEPLDGYDELSEAEAQALLLDLSDEDLAKVQTYERTHKARGSITRYKHTSTVIAPQAPVDDDLGPSPEPTFEVPAESTSEGYDSMKTEALQAEADKRGINVIGTGTGGNVLKKDLVAALQADDAKRGE